MPLTVSELMEKMPGAFIPEKAQGVDAVIHFKFTGEEAGEWNATIKDGKVDVAQGIPSQAAQHDPHRRFQRLRKDLHRRNGWYASLHAGQDQTGWRLEPGDEIDADVQDTVKATRRLLKSVRFLQLQPGFSANNFQRQFFLQSNPKCSFNKA